MNKRAFSVIELIMVVVIIGILAVLAFPSFKVARENALVKEAQANLKLIQAAEKIYGLEATFYRDAPDTSEVNSRLSLDIPTATNWAYSVDSSTTIDFRARAIRAGGTPIWCIRKNELEPVSDASCN